MKTIALCLVFFMVISVIPDLCYSMVCTDRFCRNGNWNHNRCFGCCAGKGYWGGWCFLPQIGGYCICFAPGVAIGKSKRLTRKGAKPEDGTKE